ncbi:MAG: type VI secretion system lipoprotein TssJ [Gammaproteobacteria bacterium]|nr:MAG: type VI secretion system lipoprotein TssJ [Gammaproteobacteria bacterium]
MKTGSRIICILLITLMTGCASWIRSDTTKLDLRVTAGGDVNPDLSGRPSPVVVRVFELRASSVFENADFVALYEYTQDTLGVDLVKSEEWVLAPGENRRFKYALSPETNFVAVMAAYRDISSANWRYTLPVAAGERNVGQLVLGAQGIQSIRKQD